MFSNFMICLPYSPADQYLNTEHYGICECFATNLELQLQNIHSNCTKQTID
jgi:hypothetical protein